ncbi:MAG TPA: DUF6754 domain-containing protein [Anaerolineales bacterium]|nr:DUF6754 domain-containing protein [Anaerolineales bacterium]
MTVQDWLTIGIVAGLAAALIVLTVAERRWPTTLRRVAAFDALDSAIERAVEGGERVHLSLGTGSLIGSDCAPALAGAIALAKVAEATTMSDRPVVASAGDGALAVLAQEALRGAYARTGAKEQYRATSGRMLGPTPFSYAAALPVILSSEKVSVHLLTGSFGAEGALAADMGERQKAFVLAGSDEIQTQALFFTTAEHALIGEEVFVTGAYLQGSGMQRASLRLQDGVRLALVAAILLGTLLRTLGVL